LLNFRSWYRI